MIDARKTNTKGEVMNGCVHSCEYFEQTMRAGYCKDSCQIAWKYAYTKNGTLLGKQCLELCDGPTLNKECLEECPVGYSNQEGICVTQCDTGYVKQGRYCVIPERKMAGAVWGATVGSILVVCGIIVLFISLLKRGKFACFKKKIADVKKLYAVKVDKRLMKGDPNAMTEEEILEKQKEA